MAGYHTGNDDTLRVSHVETGTVQATIADDINKSTLSFIALPNAVCVSCRVLVVSPIHG